MRLLLALGLSLAFLLPFPASAADEAYEAEGIVTNIVEETLEPRNESYQVVEVEVTSGQNHVGERFRIDSRESYTEGLRHVLNEDDRVKLSIFDHESGTFVYITDLVRLQALYALVFVFVLALLLVGLWRGIYAIAGLVATLAILFGYILPQLLAGHSPLLIVITGAAMILAVAIYGTHGFRPSAHAAFLSTLIGLTLTGTIATIFTALTRLSGLGSEDAAMLQLSSGIVDFQGLLLAGIILGACGVLDDIAVTQSETVFELKTINPKLTRAELYERAIRIGRHHIASVVNTLVLAYAGASLPLLMLFLVADRSIADLLNAEFLAEEIVRTLVGTIGLILTVPIATWFASHLASKHPSKSAPK